MKKFNLEMAVGIFVLVGILCLSYLSIRLGKLDLFGADYYHVYADFDSVTGLKQGASVEIAGVDVGKVAQIGLDPKQVGRARVELQLKKSVQIQDDVIASIHTQGLIGDKFIVLKLGGSDRVIPPGGTIRDTESSVDLEDLLSKYIHGNVD